MLEPLVLAYVGDGKRGLDIIRALDQRLHRPVHLLTTMPEATDSVVDSSFLDAVVCGLIESSDLQQVVDAVADENPDIPVFDLSGSIAAVPESVDLHQIYPGESRAEAADELVGAVLSGTGRDRKRVPRTLGQYVALDNSWVVTDWDPRLESWTGRSPDDAVGESLWELFPEWDGSDLHEVCRAVRENGDPTTTEIYHEPADAWLDLRVVALESGGIECFLRDISDYKQTEQFDGPTERFEDTLERITDAFFALDNEDRFVLLNSRAEEVLDVEESEVTGVRFWDAFPAAISTSFYSKFNEAMQSQEPTSFEEYYRPRDRWFEVNAYPSDDGLSVFLRDVTEQVQLQQKLESLHDVTRELIVAESDTDIAEGTVEATEEILDFQLAAVWRYNDATDKLDPLAWSEQIDDRVDEMSPLDRDSEFIWEVYETGESRQLGFVPATTSTSHHPGKVTSELLVPVGEYGVIGAYSDQRDAFDETDVELFRLLSSTVESAFARTLRERQLAQRNERLNDFASVVSHDLRNPLNIASAHAELARDAEDPQPHIEKIDTSLGRMEDLIEDLLARARGDQDLDREPVSLSTIAGEAWESVDTAEATLDIRGDGQFDADPDRLRQLFENLIRNSIDHGREDVTVRIGVTEDGFFVADDGPGVPPDDREEIFEQGVTRSEEGTGYGLAIVTDIVDGHGWSISVADSWANGARFEISGVRSLSDVAEAQTG
ncbi:PAS domain-containing protein [Halovenus sp. WSH3]|uniref:histidine kinase n=1 Tax=Halovenus carboxidivorans TaxID=2692199 RepID=A0A6B0T5I0_9EURY|nr:PAS domain-containing protein [Halovenus carboxidivorans]MXR50582.1 PAS domain-containing protein [Halovenus carboxidivorans]